MKNLWLHQLISAKKSSDKHYLIDFCESTGLKLEFVKKLHLSNHNYKPLKK